MNQDLIDLVTGAVTEQMEEKHRYRPAPIPELCTPEELRGFIDRRICDCGELLPDGETYRRHMYEETAKATIREVGNYLDAAVRGTSTGLQAWKIMCEECGINE